MTVFNPIPNSPITNIPDEVWDAHQETFRPSKTTADRDRKWKHYEEVRARYRRDAKGVYLLDEKGDFLLISSNSPKQTTRQSMKTRPAPVIILARIGLTGFLIIMLSLFLTYILY
jgi:hypothetical protein